MISKQRRWQIKQVKAGRCQICKTPRNRYKHYCDFHGEKMRKYMLEYMRTHKHKKVAESCKSA